MEKLLILFLIILILISSCTTTRMLSKENQTEFYHEINKWCKDRKAEMVLLNGRKFQVYNLRVSADSTFWQDSKYYKKQSISTVEIAEIKRTNRLKGAGQGFLAGILGMYIPLSIIYAPSIAGNASTKGAGYAFKFFGTVGGSLGLLIGAGTGAKDRYILNENE